MRSYVLRTLRTLNPILHGGGWNPHAHVDDLAWLLRGCPKWAHFSWLCFFQHFNIEAIFKKIFFWNLEKLKNRALTLWLQGKKSEKVKKLIFFSKSYFFNLNLNSTCYLLCFDIYIIYFPQNFEIFIFFAIKFSSICNVSPPTLVAKLVFKGCRFGYLWTARDQNLYLRSNLTIQVIDQPHFIS